MARSYLSRAGSTRTTPQSKPIPGSSQVPNSAGGYAWEVTPLTRLRRFLVLGSEGGSYYVGERELTEDNALAVRAALDAHGPEAVEEIASVSESGRAPKNDPALFALAMAAAHPRDEVRAAALRALPRVARTGTHLFHFVEFAEGFRGWGRGLRRAVADWYVDRPAADVAYQAVKYQQRDGWSHRDLLRLCKEYTAGRIDDERDALFRWIVGKAGEGEQLMAGDGLPALEAYQRAQRAETPAHTAALVREFGGALPREAIKPEHAQDRDVWLAQLEAGMPMTAMIRNLASMTRAGLLAPMADANRLVADRLADEDALRRARVHPIAVLGALATYQSGTGARGRGTWTPVREIVDALDAAFYLAFGTLERTGKRTMLALDISASMTWSQIAGMPGLRPREASAAMALVQANVGDPYAVTVFASSGGSGMGHWGIQPVDLSPRQRLDDALRTIEALPAGGTDCSLPMVWAMENGVEIDTVVIYTDSETWAGQMHPAQALQQYREKMGIDARLVVVGMVANDVSIADPDDAGMLDVVGFDVSAPQLISDFGAGRL